MTDKEKILKGFEELNAIIEPYKNKRNYNKLCLMLKFWAQNFKRSLLWKKAPASKDLEEAAFDYAEACKYEGGEKLLCIEHFKAGAKYKEEQFEKNRLEHCNSITNEQAELEQKFVDQHIENNHRIPTFLDAIEYGMRSQKEQMMKGAIDATVESNPDAHGADYGLQKLHIDYGQLEAKGIKPGTKVKVIIIKED